jgi:DNA-binding transcriptional LysR family regulator
MDKILQQFIEVATLKNVSHAAKKMCLSQPTVTHNMKKLEESLEVQLFVRTSNGVKLTEFGDVLLEQTRIMQRIYDNTLTKMEMLKERHERELRIGSGHAWWYVFLKDAIAEYRQEHPAANIYIDIGNHLRLMDLLLSGDIDLFIGHEISGLNKRAGVLFIPLFISQDKVFVRQGHPLSLKQATLDELVEYPTIEITPDEVRHAHILEDSQPKKLERTQLHLTEKILYRSNSIITSIDLACSTNGLLPFPGSMASFFARFNLVSLDLTEEYTKGSIGIYLIREKQEDMHIQDVLNLIKTHLDNNRHLIV